MEKIDLKKCRNCSYDLEKGIRRCPYCGILNPTLENSEIYKTIFIILSIFAIYTYYFQ